MIPDPNLAAAVRETLGLSEDAVLTAEVLQQLSTLEAPGSGIVDLTGLEYAVNLTSLDLTNFGDQELPNQVSDISVVANLTGLKELYLGNTDVSDISVLANLTALEGLGLNYTPVSDISILANFKQLEVLDLDNTQVSDIVPLVENTGLDSDTFVNLVGTPLNAAAINTHIPALRERGVTVWVEE